MGPCDRLTPSMAPANENEELLVETTPYQEAACESTREAVWLKRLLIEQGLQELSPDFLLCDN